MKIISNCLTDTKKIAEKFATTLKKGDVVLLNGDLGSGKTTFTQFVFAALGVKDVVNSPTFSILKIYHGKFTLYHFDTYRITTDEAIEAGFDEVFSNNDGVIFVEWAENIAPLIPSKHKVVSIKNLGETVREISIKD